jgi:hypothetical protein
MDTPPPIPKGRQAGLIPRAAGIIADFLRRRTIPFLVFMPEFKEARRSRRNEIKKPSPAAGWYCQPSARAPRQRRVPLSRAQSEIFFVEFPPISGLAETNFGRNRELSTASGG